MQSRVHKDIYKGHLQLAEFAFWTQLATYFTPYIVRLSIALNAQKSV